MDEISADVLPPEHMARWLRETASSTRARGNQTWSGSEVRVAKHVAFRIKQAADMIEKLQRRIEEAESLVRQATPSRSILTEEGVIDWQARRFEWLSDSATHNPTTGDKA